MPDEGVLFDCTELMDDVLAVAEGRGGRGEVGGPAGGDEVAVTDSVVLEGGLRSTGVAAGESLSSSSSYCERLVRAVLVLGTLLTASIFFLMLSALHSLSPVL